MLAQMKGKFEGDTVREQLDNTFRDYNMQKIQILKKRIKQCQTQIIDDTNNLNKKREEYKKILGIKKCLLDDEDEMYNALAFDIDFWRAWPWSSGAAPLEI